MDLDAIPLDHSASATTPERPVVDDALFDELYPGLWRYAAAVCGTSCDPDDVLQEALVRTLRIHDLEDLDHPAAYLRKVILNVSIAEARHAGPRRVTYDVSVDDVPDATPTAYPSDLSDLMRLTPADRTLLYLVDVERLDFAAAATILGCSSSAARKRASRARRELRHEIEGEAT